ARGRRVRRGGARGGGAGAWQAEDGERMRQECGVSKPGEQRQQEEGVAPGGYDTESPARAPCAVMRLPGVRASQCWREASDAPKMGFAISSPQVCNILRVLGPFVALIACY